MYETLSHLRRKNVGSFDISFSTQVQAEDGRLCFILPPKEQRSVEGVLGRIVWDETSKDLKAIYLLPRKLGGVLVGMGPCMYDAPPDSSGFDTVGVEANAYKVSQSRLTFGVVDASANGHCGIAGIRSEVHTAMSTEFILSEHLDFIIGHSIQKRI